MGREASPMWQRTQMAGWGGGPHLICFIKEPPLQQLMGNSSVLSESCLGAGRAGPRAPSRDTHKEPELGRKSPSVRRAARLPWRGDNFPRAAPLPQLRPLAAGAVLRGKEAFPVPPPISQHSWQAQRRAGSRNREGGRRAPRRKWGWGGGGHGAQRGRGGRWGGLCSECGGFPPAGVSARPTPSTEMQEEGCEGGRRGFQDNGRNTHAWSRGGRRFGAQTQAGRNSGDCPVAGHGRAQQRWGGLTRPLRPPLDQGEAPRRPRGLRDIRPMATAQETPAGAGR